MVVLFFNIIESLFMKTSDDDCSCQINDMISEGSPVEQN